jgi:nitrogen fixation/metabolism regulation signal transduction histidine kinase
MDEAAPLRNFHEQELQPFLQNPGAHGSALGDAAKARTAFAQLRRLVPPSLHTAIEDMEGICEEERQLTRQRQLHLWLHGWLLLHIPLSLALILLSAIHAVMAVRY